MSEYIEFIKGDNKNTIKITCGELLNSLQNQIKSIEIYYNPYKLNIEGDIKGAKFINIFTKEEV